MNKKNWAATVGGIAAIIAGALGTPSPTDPTTGNPIPVDPNSPTPPPQIAVDAVASVLPWPWNIIAIAGGSILTGYQVANAKKRKTS